MATNINAVSKSEKRAILFFSLVASLFVCYLFVDEAIHAYREAVFDEQMRAKGISFSKDWSGRRSPAVPSLLFPLITTALIRPKRFRISTALTALLSIIFLVGSFLRILYAKELGIIRPIRDSLDAWDFFFGSFLLVLLAWQVSILWRTAKSLP